MSLPQPLLAFEAEAKTLAAELARIDAAFARFRSARDSGHILPNSVEAIRVELTYHSNAIEGSTLSLRETQLVLEGHAPPGGKSLREIYEARNHDRALTLIESWAQAWPIERSLTEDDLLQLHAQVLADIDPRSAGRLRTDRVLIKGSRFIPPGSHTFSTLVPALLERANRPGSHPALQAAELHYNLVAVHPFADGNGRTARLLMNLHLLRQGFPHTIIEVDRRAQYLSALEDANAGNAEPFARFIADCVDRSIERLVGNDD
ncbi:MAG: Fic family protein [Phycisphaerales bacterium]|nr:MAG: Fic family protein [Phycisphaerales bacterium]